MVSRPRGTGPVGDSAGEGAGLHDQLDTLVVKTLVVKTLVVKTLVWLQDQLDTLMTDKRVKQALLMMPYMLVPQALFMMPYKRVKQAQF